MYVKYLFFLDLIDQWCLQIKLNEINEIMSLFLSSYIIFDLGHLSFLSSCAALYTNQMPICLSNGWVKCWCITYWCTVLSMLFSCGKNMTLCSIVSVNTLIGRCALRFTDKMPFCSTSGTHDDLYETINYLQNHQWEHVFSCYFVVYNLSL